MSEILITGGAGYIGSVMVPMFLEEGYKVTVLDNFMYRQNSLLDCCYYRDRFNIVRGDIRNKELVHRLVDESDIIIHLASIVGAPACDKDPSAARSVIRDSIWNIIHARKRKQPIIYPNTNSGYGVGQDGIYCDESSPLRPVSLYGEYKVAVEDILLKHENTVSLRLATVFGISPRMRLDLLVNDFVYRAVNDRYVGLFESSFKRNYIHVRDVARAFMHCITKFEKVLGQAYNVGLSNANLSKLELCREIQKQVPDFHFTEVPVGKDPDKRNYIVSNAKFEATGFKPQISLENGIAELVKGYQIIKANNFGNI